MRDKFVFFLAAMQQSIKSRGASKRVSPEKELLSKPRITGKWSLVASYSEVVSSKAHDSVGVYGVKEFISGL